MFDQTDIQQVTPADAPVMQRVAGAASVVIGPAGLEQLHQRGSAKAILPRVHGAPPEVVFLNTAGGLTGGDRLDYRLEIGAGCAAVGTTQTAERAYASSRGDARLGVHLSAGAGARLDWLPQETILFQDSSLARETRVDLAGDATFLMIETLVLGRAAMGETLTRLTFRDLREVRRDGVPVLVEPLHLGDAALARAPGGAILGGARAVATLALVAPGAEDALASVRAMLADQPIQAAASAWDGKLVVRAMAADGWPLRRAMANVLRRLRHGPLPRVWQI